MCSHLLKTTYKNNSITICIAVLHSQKKCVTSHHPSSTLTWHVFPLPAVTEEQMSVWESREQAVFHDRFISFSLCSLFSVLCSLFHGRILLQDSRLLIMAQHRAWCNYTLLWCFRCCSACLIIVIEVGTFWNGRHIHTELAWTKKQWAIFVWANSQLSL